mmetsp:Transcript_2051/g.2913  ORF Transcript_2051/g.2913 Transcript_2051/m.2913 type:complete len:206 (+) Transcript_2051:87-704(+)
MLITESRTSTENSALYKVIFLGKKSARQVLLQCFLSGKFQKDFLEKKPNDFSLVRFEPDVRLQIWNSETEQTVINSSIYRGASGAIIVYSPTDTDSLDLLKAYLGELDLYADPNVKKLLVAASYVEQQEPQVVDALKAKALAEQHDAYFMAVDCHQNQDVQTMMKLLVGKISTDRPQNDQSKDNDNIPITIQKKTPKKKLNCIIQ